jgi:AcrR family transcriptional regulator
MTSVGEKKRLPRPEREQQMIDAAIVIFARRGYHKASMDDIAARAGISKPMLYMYLGSKADLFRACMRRETDRFLGAIRAAVDPGQPTEEQVFTGVNAFFTFVADYRDAWNVLYRQARDSGGPLAGEVATIREMVIGEVAAILRRAAEADGVADPAKVPIMALATALLGAAESLTEWILDHPGERPEETSILLMSLVWNGLGNTLHGLRWERGGPDGLRRKVPLTADPAPTRG